MRKSKGAPLEPEEARQRPIDDGGFVVRRHNDGNHEFPPGGPARVYWDTDRLIQRMLSQLSSFSVPSNNFA